MMNKKLSRVALPLAIFATFLLNLAASAQIVRDGATTLIFYNRTANPVAVMVAVPGLPCKMPCIQGDGCPNGTVANLRTIDISAGGQPTSLTQFGTPAQGWFILPAGHRVQVINMALNPTTRMVSSCFQGVLFGFGQVGNSCPDFAATAQTAFPVTSPGPLFNTPISPGIKLPNGSNAFEASLNLPGTVGGATTVSGVKVPVAEGMDISCVDGANSLLEVSMTPPVAGPYWNTLLSSAQGGLTYYKTTTTMANSTVDIAKKIDKNCVDPATGYARPGIFPYGCSQCNTYPDPKPPCFQGQVQGYPAQICAAKNGLVPNNGCLFNRSPLVTGIQKFGGTVQVTYLGPAIP